MVCFIKLGQLKLIRRAANVIIGVKFKVGFGNFFDWGKSVVVRDGALPYYF